MKIKENSSINIKEVILLSILITAIVFISKYLYDNKFIDRYIYGGQVSGYAYNEKGAPLEGVAFIIGYPDVVNIDSDGYFILENIPQGQQALALGYDGKAVEFSIQVFDGKTTNVGKLTYRYIE